MGMLGGKRKKEGGVVQSIPQEDFSPVAALTEAHPARINVTGYVGCAELWVIIAHMVIVE
uniref:Uncharacterized protein n=1 Tax=Lutzomyia longipalpis TaxID=7200 RepID=A0A1B0CSQ9_LUTLO